MTTRYVIRCHYRIDGILRAVPQCAAHSETEGREFFRELQKNRPNRCYDLVRETIEVLERSAEEPQELTYNPGGSQ